MSVLRQFSRSWTKKQKPFGFTPSILSASPRFISIALLFLRSPKAFRPSLSNDVILVSSHPCSTSRILNLRIISVKFLIYWTIDMKLCSFTEKARRDRTIPEYTNRQVQMTHSTTFKCSYFAVLYDTFSIVQTKRFEIKF